ncbi:MAG: glycosyltransferase family 4 protein [Ruminococcaceae bacterium]|nr:glycosyltransferase family 4 protein [Oscillospiraceae bacterium]
MYKVCHMTSAHPRYDPRILEKECTSLARAGFQVNLVVNDKKADETINGVNIISTGMTFSGRKARMTKGAKAVYKKALELNADIYHFHDPELLPYGLKLAKAGKHVVYDSHEDCYKQISIKTYIPGIVRKPVAKFFLNYESKVSRRVDAVIFPAQSPDGNTIFHGRSKRDVVIGNLPILGDDRDVDVRSNLSKKTICQVGALTEARGITEMVIAGYRTGSTVILAGPISESYMETLKQMPEFACVDYRGVVKHHEVKGILKESAIGFSVLHNVGQYRDLTNLPTKVYEYGSFGLPIIGSVTPPSLKEFLEKNHCGIAVDSENVDEIVNAINYIYNNADEAVTMGQNAKTAVERDYNWETDAKKLVELYNEILG